jgi:hypothetical protein
MKRAPQQRIDTTPAMSSPASVRNVPSSPGGRDAFLSLQRTSGNRAISGLVNHGSGAPLDSATRDEMESRFGQDFGGVRIHNDQAAHKSTLHSAARALTHGKDIAFGKGFYEPGTQRGKTLIAHELAHVIQQTRPNGQAAPAAAAETEARQAGEQAAGGGEVSVQSAAAGVQADLMSKDEVEQAIADNEARAEKATSSEEIQALFEERNNLYDQLKTAPERIQVPGGPPVPAKPREKPKPVRIDYEPAADAFSGTELEYTARGDYPSKQIYVPGVYKSAHYWLAPHMQSGTEKVVYYLAYNPETKRNEYVVGPGDVQNFVAHEDLYWYNAAAAYPLAGDMPDYKAKSGRMVSKMMQGKYGEAFDAWKDSWSAAVRDPQFWVESVTATAGAFVGPEVSEVESATASAAKRTTAVEATTVAEEVPKTAPAPARASTPAAPAAPATATTVEEVFAELDSELTCVPEAPGPLQGTAQGGFESPTPLTPQNSTSAVQAPGGVAVRESAGASTRTGTFQSASAQTPRSMNTAIRADIGEAEAYKAALERGEIGLQRPGGSNVPGADFITAAEGPNGIEIFVNDAKTTSVGTFPKPKGPSVKPTWQAEVNDAIQPGRLDLGDAVLEQRIRDAAAAGRVRVRQVNVDYSPAGQGGLSGF